MLNFATFILLAITIVVVTSKRSRHSTSYSYDGILPCEYRDEGGILTNSRRCPYSDYSTYTRYSCDRTLDVTNGDMSGQFKFCDVPFKLTTKDACSVLNETGTDLPYAGVTCDSDTTCDAGPVNYTKYSRRSGTKYTYQMYFCGEVPTEPNHLRKMVNGLCKLENSTDTIKERNCNEYYGYTCSYGPITVNDTYGLYGGHGEPLSITYCAKDVATFNPLWIFADWIRKTTKYY